MPIDVLFIVLLHFVYSRLENVFEWIYIYSVAYCHNNVKILHILYTFVKKSECRDT